MRKFERDWSDRRNAVGFVAGCARLALRFYAGGDRRVVEDAIEVAERYARGEDIAAEAAEAAGAAKITRDPDMAYSVRYPDDASIAAGLVAAGAAGLVSFPYTAGLVGGDAAFLAADASDAGVDCHELAIVYARWVVRDLSPRWPIDKQIRQAAGAAIVAGDKELARELLR